MMDVEIRPRGLRLCGGRRPLLIRPGGQWHTVKALLTEQWHATSTSSSTEGEYVSSPSPTEGDATGVNIMIRTCGLLRRIHIGCLAIVCTTALTLAPQAARADLGDIGRSLFRGLSYAGNQQILSSPQNGPFFNANQQFQRVEYNRLGQGYSYEQWRFFGFDTYGNPNTLDLGPVKVQLGRDPNIVTNNEPVGLHTRVGYTTTFIPEIFFQQDTAQRNQNILSGTSTPVRSPLRYSIQVNTGVQDVTLEGNVFLESSGRLNALGFYDINARLTNDGTYETNGVFAVDSQVTDFDIGPIDISGNIIMDAVSAIAQLVTGTNFAAIPTRVASGAAQKERSLDELVAALEAGEELTGEERLALVQQTLQAAFLNDPLGALVNGLPGAGVGNDAISLSFRNAEQTEATVGGVTVPEPGTLMLLASASVGVGAFRRRRA